MFLFKRKKQKEYLEQLRKAASSKDFEGLEELYYGYKLFCRTNGLANNLLYNELIGRTYILDVSLERSYGELEGLPGAVNHLNSVISNESLVDGISLEEAEILLGWVVKNAVDAIVDDAGSLSKNNMASSCYFAQAVTAFPFITAGLPCTINNTKYFVGLKELMFSYISSSAINHPFITASLPVKIGDTIIMKRYLIDITYKQFFTADNCNKGVYSDDKTPDPGYFVCQTKEGIEFATELLRKGYIELTAKNANIYGSAFSSASQEPNESMLAILWESKVDYTSIIDQNQEELAYSADNIDLMDATYCFPGIELKNKKTIGKFPKE